MRCRDSVTGKFVSREYAEANKATTQCYEDEAPRVNPEDVLSPIQEEPEPEFVVFRDEV